LLEAKASVVFLDDRTSSPRQMLHAHLEASPPLAWSPDCRQGAAALVPGSAPMRETDGTPSAFNSFKPRVQLSSWAATFSLSPQMALELGGLTKNSRVVSLSA